MAEISKTPLSEYMDKQDKPATFTHEGDKSGKGSISFINVRKHKAGNAYLSCLLVWCQGDHFYFTEDGVRTETSTWSEILQKGKAYLFDLVSGPEAAINRINTIVDTHVSSAKLKMDLRMAEFRGMLFAQTQSLKLIVL